MAHRRAALCGLALIIVAVCLLTSRAAAARTAAAYRDETVVGWRVHVGRALLDRKPDLAERCLRRLRRKLDEIAGAVPERALATLRAVPIWVELDTPGLRGLIYHPSRDWLATHGDDERKAKSVEIARAAEFVAWEPAQPSFLLHELAHAFHDRVLGPDEPTIRAAYRQARAAGLYAAVKRNNGEIGRACALSTSGNISPGSAKPISAPTTSFRSPGRNSRLTTRWGSRRSAVSGATTGRRRGGAVRRRLAACRATAPAARPMRPLVVRERPTRRAPEWSMARFC
jgi:hypothetical protein